jgi:tetratricopeptide (TPR) repeat protein
MSALTAVLLLAVSQAPTFEVNGRVEPPARASVTLHGATTAFTVSTLTNADGRFRFRRVLAGQYTVAAFSPGYGERRITIDVGPASVDAKGRFELLVRLDENANVSAGAKVSAAELRVPDSARREYSEAQHCLTRRDVDCAIRRLNRATEIAPGYAQAWNNLGTLAYHAREYPKAESHFRRALEADSGAYEPLVNLGGVLLSLNRPEEAYHYNLHSVLARPSDALANSQLGMTYFMLGKPDLAEKYLEEARKLDPAHFSHPQLFLAEIHLRRGQPGKAADILDEFLRYHPNSPNAERMREQIVVLRNR